MNNRPEVVYIDNKEYKTDVLTEDQKKLFNKTTKWQIEAIKLKDAFEDANRMHQSYFSDLKKSLEKDK
mgnify:CR=1 FL=1